MISEYDILRNRRLIQDLKDENEQLKRKLVKAEKEITFQRGQVASWIENYQHLKTGDYGSIYGRH